LTLVGILLSAAYSLILVTRVIFGPASVFVTHYYDLTRREFYILLPLFILIMFLGIFPSYVTSLWSFTLTCWYT
jgi:NADH:ubiquinone oxidoreductase subunit 4 (subunit M)